jgi:glycosyltransferase involved in cell wall biosynthesis
LKIILWQNMLSHLQSAHVRAMAEGWNHEVTIIGLDTLSASRRMLGWATPDFGRARVIEGPGRGEISDLIRSADDDAVHMLAGWRGLRHGRYLLSALRERSARIGLLTEGADGRGFAGSVRKWLYGLERLMPGVRFDFILAMGSQGAEWFADCGFPRASIFPYCYITERPPAATAAPAPEFSMLYLGQLIRRKGLDLLIAALSRLRDLSWRLRVVGGGPDEARLKSLSAQLGLQSRIAFLPPAPYREAMGHVAASDVLVLPSRFDGWGAVVNEALMSGVPAVCSDRCGAKDLLADCFRGATFSAGSVNSLSEALSFRIGEGKTTAERSESIRKWSERITGPRGAAYVSSVLAHVYSGGPRPTPIWAD